MDALTPERREQVSMFQSVTHETSASQAISLLASCGWNVEQAIATHFAIHAADGGTSGGSENVMQESPIAPPPAATRATSTGSNSSSSSFMTRNAAAGSSRSAAAAASPSPAPASPASRGWPGSGLMSRVSGVFSRALWGTPATSSAALTPQQTFLQEFAATYGPHVPEFASGSYAEAVQEARTRGRMLFIYLHCPTHDNTEEFVRATLCVEATCNFLRENFVSWMGTIKHADAYKLCQTFNVASFPYIAVLAPQSSANSVAVVYRHTGLLTSETLLGDLLQRMEMHTHITQQLSASKAAEDAERHQARTLREQQDLEYEESLLMDQGIREAQEREAREMEELMRLSRETELAEAAERQRQAELEEERKAAAEAERVARLAALPEEPAATADGVVNIAFRLPNSKKVSRRFLDSQTLGTVQQYLASLEDMAPIGPAYRILSNFPRKVHEDAQATLASLRLGKQIQLIVEDAREADDDEEQPQA